MVDPLKEYLPLEHFKDTDDDASTVRIRDMPYGKRREKLTIFPTSLIFPPIPMKSVSVPYPVMITNTGYDAVAIRNVRVVGDFATFGQVPIISLVPGQYAFMQLTYNPKRQGDVTGGVYLNTGSAVGEEFIRLAGSATAEAGTIVWMKGVGTPEGVVAADVGSVFCRTDGGTRTTLYVKETGGSTKLGWVAK